MCGKKKTCDNTVACSPKACGSWFLHREFVVTFKIQNEMIFYVFHLLCKPLY